MKWKQPHKPNNTNTLGSLIENAASQWLQQQGLKLLRRNYRCRVGEIDIILLDGAQIVFVEVRYRKHQQYGSGLESVDRRKQQKLSKAAVHFIVSHSQYQNSPCRFDVVSAKIDAQHQKGATLSTAISHRSNVSPNYDINPDQLHWTWVKDAF